MSICNAKNSNYMRIINPYTQDIRITNPNGLRNTQMQARTLAVKFRRSETLRRTWANGAAKTLRQTTREDKARRNS